MKLSEGCVKTFKFLKEKIKNNLLFLTATILASAVATIGTSLELISG